MRDDGRFGPLARQEQCPPVPQLTLLTTLFEEFVLGVFFSDRPECSWSCEQGRDFVFFDYPPECPGVRRSDRLAFIKDCCCAREERCIDNVRVPHDPADITASEDDVPRSLDVEEVFDAEIE